MIFFGSTPRTALLTAMGLFIYGCPGAPFRFLGVDAAALIALLDVRLGASVCPCNSICLPGAWGCPPLAAQLT